MQDLKIPKGFEIDSPQTYHDHESLLGSSSRIILEISLLLNDVDEVNLAFLFKNARGSLLESFIKEYCSAKKEFRFLFKICYILPLVL